MQRIYIVTPPATNGAASKPRLVRANNRTQALRHVASEFIVDLAGQEQLVALLAAQTPVEDARDVDRDTDPQQSRPVGLEA